MPALSRRRFGLNASLAIAALAVPSVLRAQARPRVVVLGGGAGGGTAARQVAKDGAGSIDVTLIEQSSRYTTCFFSNLYLGGYRDLDSITHGYDRLASGHGIRVVNQRAAAIDRQNRQVVLADGAGVPYDRLVLSPGIDLVWDSVPGYSEAASGVMPHAWKAGPQTTLLKARLDALRNGEHIVVVAPPNPYRCPPGPYERVSMMAHVLKAKGFTDSRIVVLDPKKSFSKQALFAEGWERHYPGMVEWYGPDVHGGIKGVDPAAGTVRTDLDTFKGALVNVIPAQRAGAIAAEAGLTDATGYCPIDPASMRSRADEAIFVVGDACIAGDMPKSAFSANSQAKVAAMQIRGELTGARVFPARYSNTCWSLIETDDSVKVGGQYAASDGRIAATSTFVSQIEEDAALRRGNAQEAVGWYEAITADIFG